MTTRSGWGVRLLVVLAVATTSVLSGHAGQVGQAQISGSVVTTGVSPAPLARALVTISAPSLKPSRTVITDEQGRFIFRDLPAGSFTIVAARPPYVKTTFGAKRPGRPGTPIDVTTAQHVTGMTIALTRGSAITGVIRNSDGEAAPGSKSKPRRLTHRPDRPAFRS